MAANSSAMSRSSAALSAAVWADQDIRLGPQRAVLRQRLRREDVEAAKPIRPSRSAGSASSSTTVPRPTFTRIVPGLTAARTSAPISFSVAAVPGSVSTMASTWGTVDAMSATWISRSTCSIGLPRRLVPMIVAPGPTDFWATSWPIPEADHQYGHLRELSHLPTAGPAAVTLLGEQPRQILRAGQHAENGELRQRSAMHAGRRGEQDPAKLLLAESGGLHLAATTGSHGAPSGPGFRPRSVSALPDRRRVSRTTPRPSRALLERSLLIRVRRNDGSPEEIGRVTHRRIQRLVADQVDSWLESLDQFAVLLGEWCGDHHAQPLGSVGHIKAFPGEDGGAGLTLS